MKVKLLLNGIWETILDNLYPPDAACFLCNAEAEVDGRYICEACASAVQMAGEVPCPPELTGISAVFYYTEIVQEAVHRLKYGGDQYLARPFGRLMHLPLGCMPDAILPVPLHPNKLRARGFNQSELLAWEFSKKWDLPVDASILARVKETASQASLHKQEREKNMRGAFIAQPVQGKTLLLVDDVCTTGSTLSAAALALKQAGARAVYGACACAAV